MSTEKFFLMMGAFKAHTSILADFRTWMEKDHIPDIRATGHFNMASLQIPPSEPDYNGMCSLGYLHRVNDEAALIAYQTNNRPSLRQKFLDRWKEDMGAGRLIVIVPLGEASELPA